MGYPTPETLPAANLRRVLLIPNDPVFVGAFTGALLDLCEPGRWEQYGAVSPEDAAAAALAVLLAAFETDEVIP